MKDLLVISGATVSGGIPEDLKSLIIQAVAGFVIWGLTKLFDRKPKLK